MNGIITLGEALIDFIPVDKENKLFEKNPGGAPANVAVGLARLGSRTAFIGKVGDDSLGRFLYETLAKEGINLNNMILSKEAKTALTIVTLDEEGDRSFDFFGDESADRLLNEDEIDDELFGDYKIYHFGSISMINETSRKATKYALDLAEKSGMYVSYDPNLRESLWSDLEKAKKIMKSVLGQVDILKVSKEELDFLTDFAGIEEGAEQIRNKNQIGLVLITDGDNGVYFYRKELVHIPAQKVQAVDTTGAGDAFMAAFLNQIDKSDISIDEMTDAQIEKICEFANYCSSLVVKKQGAMSKLPKKEDIQDFFKEQ